MLRDHQCALVWVDACRHEKTFSKSWAFGCNSAKIQALEARCNHSCKHQSLAGVKEQELQNTHLPLQLAQVGVGRVSKTGSVLIPRTISLAPGRLPTCDGAGMHLTADWCHPEPAHPLQTVAKPWMHERNVVPRILRVACRTALSHHPKAWRWQTWLTQLCNCPTPKQDNHTDYICCRP